MDRALADVARRDAPVQLVRRTRRSRPPSASASSGARGSTPGIPASSTGPAALPDPGGRPARWWWCSTGRASCAASSTSAATAARSSWTSRRSAARSSARTTRGPTASTARSAARRGARSEPGFDKDGLGLAPVSVGTWGPFVFVNPDPDAEPLADALGDLPAVVAENGLDVDALRFHHRAT